MIFLQCGADSIAGDPITHLELSPNIHYQVASYLRDLAQKENIGIVAAGGGGYNRENLAKAWNEVVRAFLEE